MNALFWTVVVLLTLVTALYVAAEFAAVGVRRGQIRRLADGGSKLARGLLPVIEDRRQLDRYIASSQIGITLSSLVLGAFGARMTVDLAAILERWGMEPVAAGSMATSVVLVSLTMLHVILGELVPKSLALQYPTQVALATYVPMRWSLVLYGGFIAVLNGSGLLLVRFLGFPNAGHRHIHSPEEIEMLVTESRDGGLLEPAEQERLRQGLRLGRRTAGELIVPRRLVQMIDADTTPEELLRIVVGSPYTRLPVYRGSIDNVIGLVHTKHLAARFAEHGRPVPLESVLRPIPHVPAFMPADRLLSVLRQRGSRMALVLDEFGGVEGIVTLEDLLTELIGSVADEFKRDDPVPERLADRRVRVPGRLRLDEAAPYTGVSWDDSESTTIAGLVLAKLGRVPEPGERVTIDGVTFEIERLDGHAIASLLVTPLEPPPPAPEE